MNTNNNLPNNCELAQIKEGENDILVPTFWGHSQFGLYILVAINLVLIIFNLL